MPNNTDLEPTDIRGVIKEWWKYLLSKAVFIILIALVFGLLGVLYAWQQKPIYTAEITFAPENDKASGGMYAGIAAQFGFDVGSGGGVFEGESLMQFLKSKMLIEKALFAVVQLPSKKDLLINYYLDCHKMRKAWKDDPKLKMVVFSKETEPGSLRHRDSILNKVVEDINMSLDITKVSKSANIISVTIKDNDELFAKLLVEQLVSTGIDYYSDYRSKKNRENVTILQHQTDSVRNLLSGNIIAAAEAVDVNVNPIRQIVRSGAQRKQVDVQANGQLYGELLKQLELSKINLRKETPFIQILDVPRLPLPKKKMGRLTGAIIFTFLGGFFALIFFVLSKLAKRP